MEERWQEKIRRRRYMCRQAIMSANGCLLFCDGLKKDISKDPMFLTLTTEDKIRSSEEDKSMEDEVNPCLLLAQSRYVVSCSESLRAQVEVPMPIVSDAGSGYNVILRSALPDGWKKYIKKSEGLPFFGDGNGKALEIRHQVLLQV